MVNLKVGASDLPSPVKNFDRNLKEFGQKKIQGRAQKEQLHTNVCVTKEPERESEGELGNRLQKLSEKGRE